MPPTVLVVEDEALIAEDLRRTLTRLGYAVPVTAANGREAIRAAGEVLPSLVLMDVKLRGAMDGIEAARKIRDEYAIPIVYLTSHSDDATLARAKETEPYGYLLKPFSERELRSVIEMALHKHELETQLARRERWLAMTLSSIGDALIATDRDELITFMNLAAEKLTGWSRADAIGKRFGEVVRFVDASGAPVDSSVRAALREGTAVALPPDTSLVLPDGQRVPVGDSAAPIVDEHGQPVGGVIALRDLSSNRERDQPGEPPAPLAHPAEGTGEHPQLPRAKVLVIDDEVLSLRAVERLLRGTCDIVCVGSGEAALAQLANATFDVILCDLNMPGMSGADLFEVVEAQYPAHAARFVAMTGGTYAARAQQFLETSGLRCVMKPLTAALLQTAIAEVMAATSGG